MFCSDLIVSKLSDTAPLISKPRNVGLNRTKEAVARPKKAPTREGIEKVQKDMEASAKRVRLLGYSWAGWPPDRSDRSWSACCRRVDIAPPSPRRRTLSGRTRGVGDRELCRSPGEMKNCGARPWTYVLT